MEKKTILVVDDDIDLVESMKVVLESAGYRVSTAYEPEAGYGKAEKEKPDLILLDVMFGPDEKVKGFELAVRIRDNANLTAIPVLMITSVNVRISGAEFATATDSEYLPVDGFINKPAQPEELLRKVKELLEKKSSKWAVLPK